MKNYDMVTSLPLEELADALNCPLETFDYKEYGFSSMECIGPGNCKECKENWLKSEVRKNEDRK